MRSYYILLIPLLGFFLQPTVHACHNVLHVKPKSGLDISGRRKRHVGPHPHPHSNHSSEKDADPELSLFFSGCMFKKTGPMFESWPSVIDFILRDLYWFEASDIAYCGGYKDTARCWQRRLNFLLKFESSLMTPGKECIEEYDESIKSESYLHLPGGPAFEIFYRTHYDSYQHEPVYGEFKRFKRQIVGIDDTLRRAEDILNNLDDFLDTKFTTPRSYFQGKTTSEPDTLTKTEKERKCPKFSLIEFNNCIQSRVDELVQTQLIQKYPSLRNFNEKSNIEFFEDHMSSCRITKERRGKNVVYIENCPVSNSRTKRQSPFKPNTLLNRGEIYTVTDTGPSLPGNKPLYIPTYHFPSELCLIIDYPDVVKPASPVRVPITLCAEKYLGTFFNKTDQDLDLIPTIDPNERSMYQRPSSKGKIGSCTKGDAWTRYYNVDNQDEEGDFETLEDLRNLFPKLICDSPKAIDVRIAKGNKPHFRSKESLYISLADGFRCYNDEQKDGVCEDYKVRFCCPKQPLCEEPSSWTGWLNRKRGRSFGDRETLEYHKTNNNVCDHPLSIRARLNGSKKPYWFGNNIIEISPIIGLICRDADQSDRRCRDYSVSFCCPLLSM
uniref:uncharacterized protein LOC120342514 isoform X1 n=1 Tax=Styela clava TaxID=7725 RepID=UPI00193ADDA9|nr:uncharacterized protein LOC120342514 isoform X1 [Styela clava]